MVHQYEAQYENLLLRPLQEQDIEYLRSWRNNKEQTQYLRPIPYITQEMQLGWFQRYLENPDEIVFAIVETRDLNRIIGSVAIYEFGQTCAEVGKIQIGDPAAFGHGYGRMAMTMAVWLGIQKLGLQKLTASVHRENLSAHKSYMRMGFRIVGDHPAVMGGVEDEIEIDGKRLAEVNPFVENILLRDGT